MRKESDAPLGAEASVIRGVTGTEYFILPTPEEEAAFKEMQAKRSILDEAKEIIYGDREKTYGAPAKNLICIANYWSQHLASRHGVNVNLDQDDVCLMMVMLKVARLANDSKHRDSQVDACGYFALMERIQK